MANATAREVLGRVDQHGEAAAQPLGLNPLAKRAIELSVAEANRLNHHYVGTEHMVLGLVAQAEGIAAEELCRPNFGDLWMLRREILQILTQGGPHLRPPI